MLFPFLPRKGAGGRTLYSNYERNKIMKKTYEVPALTELTVGTADVMLFSGELITGGNDPFKSDINWDLL